MTFYDTLMVSFVGIFFHGQFSDFWTAWSIQVLVDEARASRQGGQCQLYLYVWTRVEVLSLFLCRFSFLLESKQS